VSRLVWSLYTCHRMAVVKGVLVNAEWQPRVTLKDVARAAGVSTTTASVVLTNKREGVRVAESTRQRVQAVADQLGYAPNGLARGLRTRRTAWIGFLSEQVTTTPFAVTMLAAAQEAAWRLGHLVLVVELNDHPSDEDKRAAVDLLHAQHVSGVLYATMYHRIVTLPASLPSTTVVLNAESADGVHQSVVPDDEQGAFAAVTHLLAHGHRRIAFLDDETHPVASTLRHRGYLQALSARGLTADPRLHVEAAAYVRGGLAAGSLLDLDVADRPTAIFCFNDRQAMGVYRAARQRALTIPHDLSIVGFDDQMFIASELDPPLTTMRLPHAEMGAEATELLIGADGNPQRGDTRATPDKPESWLRRVPVQLIDRDSVARPRGQH
jgi:LacI family transcriptional regulator